MGDKAIVANAHADLGIAATLRSEPNRAKALLKESLAINLELGNKMDIAEGLEALAEAAGALGQHLRAAWLWGTAGALREDIGVPWGHAERLLHEPQLAAARSRLDEAVWEKAFAEGKAMGWEEAVDYALSEEERATQAPELPSDDEVPAALTRREGEVAAMVAPGLSNRQIASQLHLSERTVENHISNRISNEPNVRLYLWNDEHISEATIKSLIAQSDRMFSKEKIGLFGVRMRGREDLLGFCGFVRLGGMEESELWYELTQKVWGRGIATEAAWACVRYAFEEVGMERVIAGADAPNTASLRVIENLGMKYVGNINPSAPEEPYFALYKEGFFAAMATG